MNLYAVLASLVGTFALLHLVAVPKAEALLRRTVASNMVARAALLSTLDLSRTIVLLATISVALTVATLWVVGWAGGSSVVRVTETLQWLADTRRFLVELDPALAVITVVILVGAMVLLARRQAKVKAIKAYDEAVSMEVDRVLEDSRSGRWKELQPNAAIQQIADETAALSKDRAALQAEVDGPFPVLLDDAEPEDSRRRRQERAVHFAKERLATVDARLLWLQQALMREEVQRRMDVRLDTTALIPRQAETVGGRLATVLASRGVVQSLRGISRVSFLASMLLLFPSMLALAVPSLEAALINRIESLQQLRIELDRREALAQVEQLKEPQPAQTPPTAADASALNILARQYEISLGRHYADLQDWREAAPSGSISEALSHERARDQILVADAERAAVQSVEIPAADARMAGLEQELREADGPVTAAGREFRADLDQTIRQGMPRRWQDLRQSTMGALADFRRMPNPAELRGMLVSSVLHAGGSGVSPELGSLLAGIDPRGLEQARLAETAHLTEALASGKPPHAAFDEFGRGPWHVQPPTVLMAELRTVAQRTPDEETILRRARDYHSGFAPKAASNEDEFHDVAARYAAATYGDAASDRGVPEAMLRFNDHFPGSMPPPGPHGPVPPNGGGSPGLSGGGGGGGGFGGGGERVGGSGRAVAKAVPAAEVLEKGVSVERVAMTRSFGRLLGFSRVGGVLIGRPPETAPKLDFTDLDWSLQDGHVTLRVKRGDRHDVVLGPYRPEIVHLALAYAADGRPVTATMVTASPLRELKILVHPALEDTALGYRAIQVDRFVDQFAGSEKDDNTLTPRGSAETLVKSYRELYQWAWAVTVTAAHTPSARSRMGPELGGLFDRLAGYAQRYLDNADADPKSRVAAMLRFALSRRAQLNDADYSPLPVKTAFFAPQQVRRLAACAADTLDETRACLAKDAFRLPLEMGPDPRLDWLAPPPDFIVWSGVREAAFEADPDLIFADPAQPRQSKMPFAPLSFILQIAFTSKPRLADPNRPWYNVDNHELDAASDEHPWQFPPLQSWINQRVADGIASHPEAQDVFAAMTEFTALQRLFRLALTGAMGPHFPVERLTVLAEASRGWVRSGVRTPRWNPRPGLLEASALAAARRLSNMDDQPPQLRQAASACDDKFTPLLDTYLTRVTLAAVSRDEWQASCAIPPPGAVPLGNAAKEDVKAFADASAARELRQKLGVFEDDKTALTERQPGNPPF